MEAARDFIIGKKICESIEMLQNVPGDVTNRQLMLSPPSHHPVARHQMDTQGGFWPLLHKRGTGGIKNSQKIRSAFFTAST